jgi:hypothetical protein
MLASGPALLCLANGRFDFPKAESSLQAVFSQCIFHSLWKLSIDVFAMQNAPEFDDPLLEI